MKSNLNTVDLLMNRAENGVQHADDGPILFEALKSAAQQHTSESEILKFLLHHIQRGYDSFYEKKRKKSAAEH